ncbi:unnamed protein product [Rhizoctonia solani]|uniref:Vegetative incompatibility protein HET-E-1 n=1 Tax=Rhizoctonia solani TaxID=456999 RepID=A0A8H3CR72_9AGAM|nr:unnamed protein product [Rhizoctonia solani]
METIAELAEIDNPQRVARAIHPLRSVLHQSEAPGVVSTLHASFPEFMLSSERSGIYFYDIVEHSHILARRCFMVMKEELRFNICDLFSSFVPDKEVECLQDKIKAKISPTLGYACRFWANHLALAMQSNVLLALLDELLRNRLLFWMEVLCLRREIPAGIDGLLMAQKWLTNGRISTPELLLLADEARAFVTGFAANPISCSTPHIYISSLGFCSHSSLIYRHYRKRTHGLLQLRGTLMERRESAPLISWTVGEVIYSLTLSRDGTRVAVGCIDHTIRILSAYDGAIHAGPLVGHANTVFSVAFSPNGELLASGSTDCTIRVWNAFDGTLFSGPFNGSSAVISVSFSPDNTRIVSGFKDGTISIWNAHSGALLLGPWNARDILVRSVVFSPNGMLIASPSVGHAVQIWNSNDGTPAASPLQGHTRQVECLAFTPDGTRIVTGSVDKTIRVWKISDRSLAASLFEGHKEPVIAVAVSPDSTRVASASGNNVRIWNIIDGTLAAGPFFSSDVSYNSLAYSPDGTRVFSGYSDGTILVWNPRDGMFPPPPLPPQNALIGIKSVTFCPDNAHFMSSGSLGTLLMWNIADGSFATSPNEVKIIPSPFSTLSHDGSFVAGTSKGGSLQVVDTVNGSLVAGPFEVESDSLSTFQFSRNNQAAIIGCHDGTIKICELQSGNTAVGSLKGHHKRVSALAESPDCSTLVSFSDYEMAFRVWDVATPALDFQLPNTSVDPGAKQRYTAIYEGWSIQEDGWVINSRHDLLFWLPPDIASAWCSPYASLVITRSGILKVPKQKLFIGDQWTSCYVSD